MKKSLLALAVLGAFATAASAQSSVTLYGTIDLNGRYVKNDGSNKRLSLDQDGINSSQLGFKGIEDLGGGLKAGFVLLASTGADSGDIGSGQSGAGTGKFWTRRSTVSLFSNAGELRLGRDYTPTFWNQTLFDAFGTVGIGHSELVQQLSSSTNVRADNMIGYYLPANIGGFYGQVNVAAAEGGYTGTNAATGVLGTSAQLGQSNNQGRYIGGRLGFAAGPFDIAVAAAQQRTQAYSYSAAGVPSVAGTIGIVDTQKSYNIGGSYDFGVVKFEGYVDRQTLSNLKETRGSVNAIIPMGQGEVHLGYNRSKLTNTLSPLNYTNTAWIAAATYQYNLSKRTDLYGTISELNNGNESHLAIASGTSIAAAPTNGGKSKGLELGVR